MKKLIIKRNRFLDIWLPLQVLLIPLFFLPPGFMLYSEQGWNFFTIGWFLIGTYIFIHSFFVIKVYFSEGKIDSLKFYKMEGIARKLKKNKFLAKYVMDPDQQ